MLAKRYSIMNFYVKGSSVTPQTNHGISSLVKRHLSGNMSQEASALFTHWLFESETEVLLEGSSDLDHAGLETFYLWLQDIPSIPSAKFNEVGLNNTCTVVTFVASDRIVAINNYIRRNRINVFEAGFESNIPFARLLMEDETALDFSSSEIAVAAKISCLKLLS